MDAMDACECVVAASGLQSTCGACVVERTGVRDDLGEACKPGRSAAGIWFNACVTSIVYVFQVLSV